jgi:hypothetical protein
MDYKGFIIYACQERCERYSIGKDGETGVWLGDCSFHADKSVLYEIQNQAGTTVGIKDSLDEAKDHIDELVVGGRVVA